MSMRLCSVEGEEMGRQRHREELRREVERRRGSGMSPLSLSLSQAALSLSLSSRFAASYKAWYASKVKDGSYVGISLRVR